ncbi:hypothetical protein QR680_010434 [Steinernema hermaphroditum]|uniref:MH1 domain-containing protein n=1 Tax=Steinernema hermaphroditum TaxID=289476 RepID=A0AA39MBP7_9BILA|nr:hypothetical protein QR680_010434 [Steinernema hermaphroditum]
MKVLLFLLGCLLLATPVLSNPPFPPGRPTTIRFPYSSYSSADDCILRRLRSRPSAVNAFVRAIHSKNFASECVPIERTLDGRSQFGDMKVSAPLHIYSVFRFPAVQKHQFVSLPNCFTDGPHEECINPYHYSHFSAFSASGEIDSESDDELQHVTILGSDGDDDNMP